MSFASLSKLSSSSEPKLTPELRERLLRESKHPLRGLRRALWVALFGSASIGAFVMTFRGLAGDAVSYRDIYIQIGALIIFGGLLWLDRSEK
ncbi:DUF3493 domain-containing protein [Prochlorococcus sp. MIT 1300]|uniref:DUF3493 domain-containing protein n=1 Tax=Prochlorococcus sp. MIT 1300 TaxID=3096218 RepID=UPI002A758BD2|nr:DUF3493 domain-containing protein [Prochlorococcus sp. MIT 1300]